MSIRTKTLRTCKKGHQYYKSTDCPTCPTCEAEKKAKDGWLSLLAAPAQRAMGAAGIKTLKQLSGYSEKEIRRLHGIGPSSIPVLLKLMKAEGLEFKKD
jgi:predicted RecB family nuclease